MYTLSVKIGLSINYMHVVKPPIEDTRGHTSHSSIHTLYNVHNLLKRTTSLQRTNGWVPMVSTIRRFHCKVFSGGPMGVPWLKRNRKMGVV